MTTPPETEKKGSPTIWFIDDDPLLCFVLEEYMTKLGLISTATFHDDGDHALIRLLELKKNGCKIPDLIFLDLQMKYVEGWQFVETLVEFELQTKIVILTSSVLPEDMTRAEEHPLVVGFMNKPITLDDLKRAIAQNT